MSGDINMVDRYCIYIIKCIKNGKVYIGSTNNFKRRLSEHKSCLKLNKHSNKFLQDDYNKYGINCFIFKKLCYCSFADRLVFEQFYIDKYGGLNSKNNYNLFSANMKYRSVDANDNIGNNNSMYGRSHTEHTKKLISEHNSMKKLEIRKKVSNTLRNKSKNKYDIELYRKDYLLCGNTKQVARKYNINPATMFYLIKYGCCNKQQHLKFPDIYTNWFNTLSDIQLKELQDKQSILRKQISVNANFCKKFKKF